MPNAAEDVDLVRQLDSRGLLSPRWRQAWNRVPRVAFIPPKIWRQLPDRCEAVADADRTPLIHSDEPVITQLDDGEPGGPGIATSSNSMPSMVARMLGLLDVHDGDRVLEIGTATGHVAALLSERLGDRNVVSVEIDPELSRQARENCRALGYEPTLVVADGEQGWPAGAPYDALICTCALRNVPSALIRQVRPGGTVVTPLHRPFWSGVLVQLTVHAHSTASGPVRGGASYMPMRSHRPTAATAPDESTARAVDSDLDPRHLLSLGYALYAGARMPGVTMVAAQDGDHTQVWLHDPSGSAAVAASGEDAWQYGPRDLWREAEAAYNAFVALGRPQATDFGLTVTPDGQRLWLGDPLNFLDAGL